MFKRMYFTLIMAFFLILTGCGTDDADQSASKAENDTETTEAVTTDIEKDSYNKAADNNKEETSNEDQNTNDNVKQQTDNSNLDKLTVDYIDADQADATLFQYTDDGESYTILFDTGDWQRQDVMTFLANKDISGIDLIATSHPDADHIGQLADIVNTYDVTEVWMSGNGSSSKTFQNALQAVKDSSADYVEPRTGDEFEIGPMNIDVLYPDSATGDLNGESLSLHMSYGEVDFVLTGDADKSAEASMVQSDEPLDADILQLGHHGSSTASTPQFIDAVDPDTAIYSAGADNQYGHPHAEVVSRIQNAGIDLYGTDVNGTITVTTDGEIYDVSSEKEGTINAESTETDESNDKSVSKGSEESPNNDGCVNINSASPDELQEIKYIGESRAPKVSTHRPYASVDDLTDVKGIGSAYIKEIKQQDTACVK